MRNAAIPITVTLTDEEAAALAAFFKRAGLSEFRACTKSEAEAYLALHAATKVAASLAQEGYA
jgi:hypothetical protein